MLKNISNLGVSLSKKEQRQVQGGYFPCQVCVETCRSQYGQSTEEFIACYLDCKQGIC